MSRADDLRREVRLLEARAKRKVQRLRREKGVNLVGSDAFPVRQGADLSSLRSRDLESYSRRLQAFNSRRTQFVPGVRGVPIRSSLWREYKAAESAHVKLVQDEFSKYANITLETGNTVAHEMGAREPTHKTMSHQRRSPLYNTTVRVSKGIVSEKALIRLTKKIKSKNKDSYFKQLDKTAMRAIENVLAGTDAKMLKDVKGLTPGQFRLLSEYTPFIENIAHAYATAQMKMRPAETALPKNVLMIHEQTSASQYANARDSIKFIKRLKI